MIANHTTVSTPFGPFTAIADLAGAVLASGWTADINDLTPLIHPTLRPTDLRWRDDLGEITRAVTAYHAGDLLAIDSIPVHQRSAEFRSHAWDILRKVPAGTPVTYTDYAALAGRPAAVRAAAGACASNAAALFVPCHRVIRADRTLGGFRWGLPVKHQLLHHESR